MISTPTAAHLWQPRRMSCHVEESCVYQIYEISFHPYFSLLFPGFQSLLSLFSGLLKGFSQVRRVLSLVATQLLDMIGEGMKGHVKKVTFAILVDD